MSFFQVTGRLTPPQTYYSTLSQIRVPDMFHKVSTALWGKTGWITIGVTISVVIVFVVIKLFKNLLPSLRITTLSTSRTAKIAIRAPRRDIPPRVTLTFCIDTSDSMNRHNRKKELNKSLLQLIQNARKIVNTNRKAKISIAIVGFNHKARVICPPTRVDNSTASSIVNSINKYRADGGTKIVAGLEKSTAELVKMIRQNRRAKHTLVLLTDGEQEIGRTDTRIQKVCQKLIALHANFYVVGIGGNHNKQTLKNITNMYNRLPNRKGLSKYFDTTLRANSIARVIKAIYEQSISVFQNLLLTSSLPSGTWSVDNARSVRIDERHSGCNLGNVSDRRVVTKTIAVHSNASHIPSKLPFTLIFTGPNGRLKKQTVRPFWV